MSGGEYRQRSQREDAHLESVDVVCYLHRPRSSCDDAGQGWRRNNRQSLTEEGERPAGWKLTETW